MAICDIIGRPLSVGDLVAFYGGVYEVIGLGTRDYNGNGSVRIILVYQSKTTRPVVKNSRDMCLIEREAARAWLDEQESRATS